MQIQPIVNRLSIRTKNLDVVKLVPNWAQVEYMEEVERQAAKNRPIRLIVLKARQLGISTVTEACGFAMSFIHEGTQGLVVAHEMDASQHLLSMTQLYWDTYPFKDFYQLKYESAKHLTWTMGSGMRITTAGNIKAGRSKTIHFLHASEVAFWPDPEKTMLGLRQTVPNTPRSMVVLESTANGVGNYFYKLWKAAESGDVDYVPLFFPWHRHPEYKASALNIPYHSLGHLNSDERALSAMGISDDRLAWRRWAIKNLADNDLNNFHQEYPSTAEEAFVSSGSAVFPPEKLRTCYKQMEGIRGRLIRDGSRVRFVKDISGPLRLYKKPAPDNDWGQYFIGGDPSFTTRGDNACAQVLNRRTLEQVAVWKGKIDPGSFAEEMAKLGAYYNYAMLAPESEGSGQITIGKLLAMEYPHVWHHQRPDKLPGKMTDIYGWSTTSKSKHLAIGWLLKNIVDEDIILHDAQTFHEMQQYVTLDNGGYGNGANADHDDHVMALAIAVTGHAMESPVLAYQGPPVIQGGQTEQHEYQDVVNGNAQPPGELLPPWEQWGTDAG